MIIKHMGRACANPHCRGFARYKSEYCSWRCKNQHEMQLRGVVVVERSESLSKDSSDRFTPWSPFR
jgi:hypothetical protein